MSRIVLGEAGGRDVKLDVDLLMRTRLLIQGGSGSGKSWLLRRLAEQLFGKLPVIIIDPEGEFATLREQFGYVLVGQGGETPADTRSAALVAHKLLELHASAVCDIFEMKPVDRHRWVRLFLDALIDAPKALWQPAIVIVDESHMFCPEKGAGESEASDAMIALTTRGRKRGFVPVFATQRLGKLRKDAAAELQNVVIGRTFIDIDRDRALETLGAKKEKDAATFSHELKTLPEGHFWAFGPAITLDRTLVQIGPVQTTHPKLGGSKHLEPPPAPEKVRALLPKLADLPQQAEQKAATEAELRKLLQEKDRIIRSLEGKTIPAVPPATGDPTPVLTDADRKLLQDLDARVGVLIDRMQAPLDVAKLQAAVAIVISEATAVQARTSEQFLKLFDGKRLARVREKLERVTVAPTRQPTREVGAVSVRTAAAVRPVPARQPGRSSDGARPAGDGLTGPEQRILDAIAWLSGIGNPEPELPAVAFLAGYTVDGGAFNNPKGRLRANGHVEYLAGGRIRLTDGGRALARAPETDLTADEFQRRVLDRLPGPEQRLLAPLLKAYPRELSNEQLADAAGYTANAGAFNNPRGRLRSLGLVDYPRPGFVAARPVLFLEGP